MAQKELAGQKVDENKNWFSALTESFDPGGVVDRFEKWDHGASRRADQGGRHPRDQW
jgi:hypothetical protein